MFAKLGPRLDLLPFNYLSVGPQLPDFASGKPLFEASPRCEVFKLHRCQDVQPFCAVIAMVMMLQPGGMAAAEVKVWMMLVARWLVAGSRRKYGFIMCSFVAGACGAVWFPNEAWWGPKTSPNWSGSLSCLCALRCSWGVNHQLHISCWHQGMLLPAVFCWSARATVF